MAYTLTYKLINNDTEYAVTGYTGEPVDVVIPKEYNALPVTSIGSRAFAYCYNLMSVAIGDGVTSIGEHAFDGCSRLYGVVTIGDSVTSIGNNAFNDCRSLTSVIIPDSVTSIGASAFYNCKRLTGVYIKDIEAWCDITFGNAYANPLYYAKNLYLNNELVTALEIPNTVTKIKSYAFYLCNSLTSVVIGDSVTSIGSYAFYDCESLTSVVIPDSVTSIGDNAFSGCSSLKSVVIPDSVTSIGASAFYNCSRLTSVTLLAKTPASLLSTNTFSSNPTFYCFNDAIEAYKTTTNWNAFANNFVADDMRLYFTMNSTAQKKYFASKEDMTILEQNIQTYIQQYIRDNFATLMAEYLNSAEATDNKPTAADISTVFNEEEEA